MSFSLSNISGSQIQKDSFINNLTVACDPGLLAPKNLNGLPNPLNLEKRDGKSAIAVDICCLDLACLNVTEKLTVNDATFNTLFASFLTADNANIDTLEGRVVNLKASNAVGAPGGAAKLTIGDTAAGDEMGNDTAIEIVGTDPSVNAIDLSTGGDITLKPQGAGPLNTVTPPDLTVYISSGTGSGQPLNISGPNNLYDIQPTGGGTGVGGQVAVTTDAGGNVTALVASVGGGGYVVGETYETTTPVGAAPPLNSSIEFVLPATSVDGPPGGIIRAYQIEAQFISGSIQGTPLVFAPNLTQINTVTQATSNAAPLNVNYLEISNGSGAAGNIVGAGNATGTVDGGAAINILDSVFIESQASQGLLVAGGIQAGSAPAFAGAYGFAVSTQGAISAPSASITGSLQVDGNTTLGNGVGGDTLTVNAVSTFNDEVTINNQLVVTGTSELVNTEITGSLQQSGGNVTLAGATTISNTLQVTGLLTANAGLTVSGLTTLNAATTINASLTAETTTTGELTVGIPLGTPLMTVATDGQTRINALQQSGGTVAGNALGVAGGVGIGGTLYVNGATTLTGVLSANGGINTPAISATAIQASQFLTNGGMVIQGVQITGNGTLLLGSGGGSGTDITIDATGVNVNGTPGLNVSSGQITSTAAGQPLVLGNSSNTAALWVGGGPAPLGSSPILTATEPLIIQSSGAVGTTALTVQTGYATQLGGALTVANTLNVTTGTTTLGGDLTVTDLATFNGGIEVAAGGVGIGAAPGVSGTLTVNGPGTFITGILTNTLGVIGGGTAVSVSGDVDITTGNELIVDSITSNAGQSMTISPAAGQDLDISASGAGQVNIATSGSVSLGGEVKVALNSYDSDAAAGAAGLATGELYQTSGSGGALPFNLPGIVMVKQ